MILQPWQDDEQKAKQALVLKPGTPKAQSRGCCCPVIDNHFGKGRYGDGQQYGWFINGECPLHGTKKED